MTLCIQCAMRAMAEGKTPPSFDETPEEHTRRVHPDLAETRRERKDLEAAIMARGITVVSHDDTH